MLGITPFTVYLALQAGSMVCYWCYALLLLYLPSHTGWQHGLLLVLCTPLIYLAILDDNMVCYWCYALLLLYLPSHGLLLVLCTPLTVSTYWLATWFATGVMHGLRLGVTLSPYYVYLVPHN